MAPCTYVGLALGAAPSGRIRFKSLEFTNIDELAPIKGLLHEQALRFGDLDFMVDSLGHLWLNEENVAPCTSRCLIMDWPELVLRSSTLMH
jgi:hypothetical protein